MTDAPEPEEQDETRRAPSISSEEAARQALKALYPDDLPDWFYLRPPPVLTEAAGIADSFDAAEAVVGAHWDGVVHMIGKRGAGYPAALALLGRLDAEELSISEDRERHAERHADVVEICELIAREGWGERRKKGLNAREFVKTMAEQRDGGHGADATLVESLDLTVPRVGPGPAARQWRWEEVASDSTTPLRYRLVLLHDGAPATDQPDADLTTFDPATTWLQAHEAARLSYTNSMLAFGRTDEERVAAFRRDVVSGVVRTFELFGAVGPYASYEALHEPPSDDDLRIACLARLAFDEGEILLSKTAVVDHVREVREARGEDARERTVRGALVRLGAYRSARPSGEGEHGAKGSQTPRGVVADLAHLRETVREICTDRLKERLIGDATDGSDGY